MGKKGYSIQGLLLFTIIKGSMHIKNSMIFCDEFLKVDSKKKSPAHAIKEVSFNNFMVLKAYNKSKKGFEFCLTDLSANDQQANSHLGKLLPFGL